MRHDVPSRRRLALVSTHPDSVVSDDLNPYDNTADGLERAILEAQAARLNPRDRAIVRRRLGLVPDAAPYGASSDREELLVEEKALAKMRHPSVAQAWRLVTE